MQLNELQTDFQKIILDDKCVGAKWVSDSSKSLTSKDRLNIYHNAYRIRLADVLMDTYEYTAIYLGDEWFYQLASRYVQSNQSVFTNIGLYGQHFPNFLAKQLEDDLDVSELALMDWKLRRAFDGANCDALTQVKLQQCMANGHTDIVLKTIPTLNITPQTYNVLDIWHAINQEEIPPKALLLPEPVDILVWRKGHSPHFRSLSKLESSAIASCLDGSNLDDIGAKLEQDYPDADIGSELGVLLHRWLEDEILESI